MNEKITQLFIKEYGFNDGLRMASVVYPNMERDFIKMVDNSLVGTAVKEEYRFDDRKGKITLYGMKNADGSSSVTGISFDGKAKIDLVTFQ